jgi:DNA helicase II / ATP-dependent DNA helicase PcrA
VKFHADLHIHSKYSRACSRDCDLEHLAWWAARKGIGVVGTGDFTHPAWAEELRTQLVPAEPGLFRLRDEVQQAVLDRLPPSCRTPVRFLLSSEISTIYKRDDRTRKVHHLLYAPDFDAVAEITRKLARIGNLTADGRPILGLDSRDLLEITLESGDDCYLVPAHAWTPWFAVLGSQSGFDAVDDCYADLAEHVFAIETGLSSDPEMNWRISQLDRFRLVSNSDAHSPPMLAREATVFDTELDYFAMRDALRTGEGFGGTVEFFPEEGKYHLDGHRACGVRTDPDETRALDGRCPACGKSLTVGVLHRVEALADRPPGHRPAHADDYRSLVPLPEIVSEIVGVGPKSKTVTEKVTALVGRLGPELAILNDVPLDDVAAASSSVLVEALARLRRGEVVRDAGYDGRYGTIHLFSPDELAGTHGTRTLFDLPPVPNDPAPDNPALVDPPTDPPVALSTATGSSAAGAGTTPPGVQDKGAGAAVRTGPPSPFSSGLDADQQAVVAGPGGPLLVVAGPGTGKTRVLTHLLARRVGEGLVPAERCLAITFTRRACAEMRARLTALASEDSDRMLVTTFHGLGLLIVREQHHRLGLSPAVHVADEEVRLTLLCDELGCTPAKARRFADRLADRKRAVSSGSPGDEELDAVLRRYDDALRDRGMVDFDDLLVLPVTLLEADRELAAAYRDRWSEICVDEYQDIDELQYRLLRLLSRPDGNVTAIGDPDQAIYGFRGGDVGYFLRFRRDFPTARVVQLSHNYRSVPTIVRAALQAIAPGSLVPDRTLSPVRTDAEDGPVVVHQAPSVQEEAEVVADTIERMLGGASFWALDRRAADGGNRLHLSFADFAVLYRTEAQAAPVTEALARRGFPLQARSHRRLADRPAVRAVVHALRAGAADDPVIGNAGAARTVAARLHDAVQTILAGTSDAAGSPVDGVRAAADLLSPLATDCGTDLDRFLNELALGVEIDTWDPRADRVSLLTLHAAKGLEFAVVFVIGCEEGLLPFRLRRPDSTAGAPSMGMAGPPPPEEPGAQAPGGEDHITGTGDTDTEERRLLFVGMTRATDHLVLTSADRRLRWGRVRECSPSPFLADIDPSLVERRTGLAGDRTRQRVAHRQLRLL